MDFSGNRPQLTSRITLTRELNKLKEKISAIGQNCCSSLAMVISSFMANNDFLLHKVESLAKSVNQESEELELNCLTILSLQQPLLKDLRFVIGSLRISSYLTRISNYSKKLADNSGQIDREFIPEELVSIAESCQLMLIDALKAFSSGSTSLALELVEKDRELDLLHDSSFSKVIKRMTQEKAELIELDAQVLRSLRFLERIGDLIAAIAKEIYFIQTGKKYH
jgi:phosphate transport system protein